MNTIQTTLTTEAVFSDDGTKRFLLRKTWEPAKPTLAIIMLAPSEASGIALDTTTQLVLNNADRLGYGGVAIVNLFATINNFDLKQTEVEDTENIKAIVAAVEDADLIVYAPGVGKTKSKIFQGRQELVLAALLPYETKLHCLCDASGKARLQHPLSPAIRTWQLSDLKITELLPSADIPVELPVAPEQKKRGKKS